MCLSRKTGAIVSDQHCLKIGKKPSDSVKPCHNRCKLRYVGVRDVPRFGSVLRLGRVS